MTNRIKTELDGKLNSLGQPVEPLDLQRAKHVQTAEAFKECEERYRAVVEGSAEGILVADIETKRLHFTNPAICRMLGYSEEELLQMSVADLHPPDSLEHVLSEFEAQARGEKTLALSIPCVRKDGTVLYADINTAGILIEGRKFNLGFFTDITERKLAEELLKKAHDDLENRVAERTAQLEEANVHLQREIDQRRKTEQELRESEVKWRSLVENAPDYIQIVDRNLTIQYLNRTAEGFKMDEVVGKTTIYDYIAPEHFDRVGQVIEKVFQTGQPADFETYSPAINRWFASRVGAIQRDGDVVSAIILSRDITERKALEEKAKQLQEYLELQIDRMPIGLILWDEKFQVKSWNPAAERIFGFSAEEMLGKHPYGRIVPNEVQPQVDEIWRRLLKGDMTAYSVNENVTKAGRTITCNWSNTPLRESDGTISGVLSMVQDITKQKRAEEQARQQLAELAHVSRVSTMGEMATGIAHELNQPLMAITGFADAAGQLLSAEKPDQTEEVCLMLSKIGEQAQRAGQIIRQMRSFVRKSETHHSTVDINQLVQEVVDLASADARLSKIRLSFNPADSIPEILADRIQIQQVVLNLLKNAFDALNEQDHAPRMVTIETSVSDDQYVEIAVKDNGTGLSVEDAERIFEMFYTSKSDGMGMGLAICRSIVEAHSGRLWAQPSAKSGATFRFTLPLEKTGVHDS